MTIFKMRTTHLWPATRPQKGGIVHQQATINFIDCKFAFAPKSVGQTGDEDNYIQLCNLSTRNKAVI